MAGDNALWEKVERLRQEEKKPVGKTKPRKSKKTDRNRDSVLSRHHNIRVTGTQKTKEAGNEDVITPSTVEIIRKGVKQLGKEVSTHRLTSEEKRALTDIVYTYGREGYRTTENEIARIALNWLIQDYREKGKQSVLAKVIEALNS